MKFSEREIFATHQNDSIAAIKAVSELEDQLITTVDILEACTKAGGTIYAFGNGGSACEAIHLVEELVARYLMERPGIRAQHLLDVATTTCWGNDYDFLDSFKRQIETFVTDKDVVVAFSTSGNSENVIRAIDAANKKNAKTILLGGKDGGKCREMVTIPLVVNAPRTMRIQEAHMLLVHLMVHLLENRLYPEKAQP